MHIIIGIVLRSLPPISVDKVWSIMRLFVLVRKMSRSIFMNNSLKQQPSYSTVATEHVPVTLGTTATEFLLGAASFKNC